MDVGAALRATLAGLAILGAGCKHTSAAVRARKVERTWTQSRTLAERVDVYATLWSRDIVAASPDASLAMWAQPYLEQTSFTVVFELTNRPTPTLREDGATSDPLLADGAWSFQLERGGKQVEPQHVEIVGLDRYPTAASGYHYRLAYDVHFDGSVAEQLASGDAAISLIIRFRSGVMESYQPLFGFWMATRGETLTWKLKRSDRAHFVLASQAVAKHLTDAAK